MSEELRKHTLNLFEGDYERIQTLYPDIGAATVIRKIVRSFLDRAEEKVKRNNVNVEVDL